MYRPPSFPDTTFRANRAMSNMPDTVSPQNLRTMQIIAGALLAGVCTFLVIVLYLVLVQNNGQGTAPPPGLPMVSLIAVAVTALCAALSFLLPRITTRAALRQMAEGTWKPPQGSTQAYDTAQSKLLAVRQTTLIIGLAPLEGAAFMGCMAYLLEAQPYVLVVIGAAILLMLLNFPTESRVLAWLDRQADQLAEMAQGRPVP
jgi:hypothetical protein